MATFRPRFVRPLDGTEVPRQTANTRRGTPTFQENEPPVTALLPVVGDLEPARGTAPGELSGAATTVGVNEIVVVAGWSVTAAKGLPRVFVELAAKAPRPFFLLGRRKVWPFGRLPELERKLPFEGE
jgi:hypothetical protein